jgi:hypothetical protein
MKFSGCGSLDCNLLNSAQVVMLAVTNVSEEPTASIFRVEVSGAEM